MTSFLNKMRFIKSEIKVFYSEIRRFYKDFQKKIDVLDLPAKRKSEIKKDYIKELIRHRYTFNEYYSQYEFTKLNKHERAEYISVSEMQRIYRRYGFPEIREIFRDKAVFLKIFENFVNRRWLLWDGSSKNELISMLNSFDCIIKPLTGTLGAGVKKVDKDSVSNIDKFIQENLSGGQYIIEECISACPEISEFHPSSLNTVRIVTFSKGPKSVVLGAFLRMGNNNRCIDNVHGGGVFAQIDVESGIVISDGIDTENNRYERHPFSKKMIKGFKIPNWDKAKEMCVSASLSLPNIRFAGWDVAIRNDGVLEIIEGNHAPDFDPMQSPLKIGVRKKVFRTLKEIGII